MKRSFPIIILLILFLVACGSSDDDDDSTTQEVIGATNQIQGGCLPGTESSQEYSTAADDDTADCETQLLLEWNGETLAVEHRCAKLSCALEFAADYLASDGVLTVYERDENDLATLCTCAYNLSYGISPQPGSYQMLLYAVNGAGYKSLRYEEEIELPAGEARSYSF